jgi:hypothetical protein
MAVFLVFLDTTALYVAYPDLTAHFADVSSSQLSWVLNSYTITLAALLVTALALRRPTPVPCPSSERVPVGAVDAVEAVEAVAP